MSDSCDPMDCSPPGSSVHGVSQARILEWVAISFSRGSSQHREVALLQSPCNYPQSCPAFSTGLNEPQTLNSRSLQLWLCEDPVKSSPEGQWGVSPSNYLTVTGASYCQVALLPCVLFAATEVNFLRVCDIA